MRRPTYGKDKYGELLYWPDASFLSVAIPAPLEQHLERVAKKKPYLGTTAQEIAVHLIRDGLMEMALHVDGWTPSHGRYTKLQTNGARRGKQTRRTKETG